LPLRQALRVAVTTNDKNDGSYMMRILPDGEAAPPGATEAIVVAIQAEADLTR
jgi:hypothetical protein